MKILITGAAGGIGSSLCPSLFEGANPLSKDRVAKETNKFSLGSTLRFQEKFGWAPSNQTEANVTKTAKEILLKIINNPK